ncbi:MAG: hypothetical protein AAF430_11990 [Myxococcota bacterium]
MNPSDTLLTTAEIAVAVLGFAGIVAVLQSRAAPMAELRLRVMVEAGGTTIAFSLLPVGLLAFEIAEESVWSIASAGLGLATLALLARTFTRQRQLFGSIFLRETIVFDVGFWVSALLAAIALALNAFSVGYPASFGVFYAGLTLVLTSAVITFVRIVYLVVEGSR